MKKMKKEIKNFIFSTHLGRLFTRWIKHNFYTFKVRHGHLLVSNQGTITIRKHVIGGG